MEAQPSKPGIQAQQGVRSFWLWPACIGAWSIALTFFVIMSRWFNAKEVNAETIGDVLKYGGDAHWRYYTMGHAHASEWKLGLAREHWLEVSASAALWLGCSYLGRWLYRRIKSPRSR